MSMEGRGVQGVTVKEDARKGAKGGDKQKESVKSGVRGGGGDETGFT